MRTYLGANRKILRISLRFVPFCYISYQAQRTIDQWVSQNCKKHEKLNIILPTAVFGILSCKAEKQIQNVQYSKEPVTKPISFKEGIISTIENREFELTFSTDGLKIYFSRRIPQGKQMIYVRDFSNEE